MAPVGGCSDDGGEPVEVEIGTGTVAYESLAAEQSFEVIEGPQGGHHVYLHVRMRGLRPGDPRVSDGPDNPDTRFQVFNEDGVQVDTGTALYRLGYREGAEEWLELPSGRLVFLDEPLVATLVDRPMTVSVEIVDSDGSVASDQRQVTGLEIPLVSGELRSPTWGEHQRSPDSL
ncbi:MAG: hypothetical protein AAGC55_25765 [Myxococcota bacterium]